MHSTLVVQLLQRKIAPLFSHCSGEKQLRRAVCLDSQYGALRLVDQTSWFELYFAGKLQYSQIMLEAVEESSRALADVLNIHSFGVLKRAFHCTGVCGSKHPVHPALLTDTNECQCTKRAFIVLLCHQTVRVGSIQLHVKTINRFLYL